MKPADPKNIELREITESDLPIIFSHQSDPVALKMAAFPARTLEAFLKHWQTNVLGNSTVIKNIILLNDQPAGHLVCWDLSERRTVGYWIGQEFWGMGIASLALEKFLMTYSHRPLYANVAKHNVRSTRVLTRNGFQIIEENKLNLDSKNSECDGLMLILN